MKRIIILLALALATITSSAQSHRHRNVQFGTGERVGFAIGGATFILAGALETPERQWTPSSTPTQSTNSYNQYGKWGWQPFYQNPNRVACLVTGITLMICSVSIKF